ncbi:KRIT1-like protein [Mya arenaria]|uniref:KRIT1-like protein n=1 Tax=Mya arenaria TaxID=6604 RepID=A0ABY7EV97_MYAAR|nr:KRIT1-like protein [Mya arenaria]
MESILAIIRPKQNIHGQDFKAKLYDILLLDHKIVDRHSKPSKFLPSFTLDLNREPREDILSYVYSMTGGEYGGIKGERALVIPWKDSKEAKRSSLSSFTLYCIPVSHRDKLNNSFVEKSQNFPGFYSLEQVISSLVSNSINFPPLTKSFVMHIEHWLKEIHTKPGVLDYVFKSRADFRVKMIVSSPVFIGISSIGGSNLRCEISESLRIAANESLARMMAIEKCTKVVINPLFGSGLAGKGRRKQPLPPVDYPSGTISRKSSLNSTVDPDRYSLEERELYPLHMYASKGDVLKVEEYISRGLSLEKRDAYGWAPIHFGAYFGHHDIVQMLLSAGCSPNIVNLDDRTPLHLAARTGNIDVVNVLLNHPEIDINVVDKTGQTAQDTCEQKLGWEHIKVSKRIEMASRMPKQIQLNQQMLREYHMPETPYADIFTIWICSPSLELQLKPEHKPLEHMNNWKRRIVGNLTDGNPDTEEPHLKWRRNAKISLIVECEVTHPDAVKLLFHEARHNYINALYPCKEQDVLQCASILLYLKYGSAEQQVAKSYVSQNRHLSQLVPMPNLHSHSNWSGRIYRHYKEFCSSSTRDNHVNPQSQFLNVCRKLTVYGSAFFTGNLQASSKSKDLVKCLIAVNDVGIHIIHYQTRQMLHTYKYSEISWQIPQQYGVLELTVVRTDSRSVERHNPRTPLKLVTKQAGMINPLMKKLSRMTIPYNI